ncbi:MAG: PaaI family thioesterase [Holophagales bacterium]|nr:PaaI family thioesterase [Holophagales bacterium]
MSGPRQMVEAWLAGTRELAPITELLGIEPVRVGEGEAVVAMETDDAHHNAMGTVHGGIFCDLADVAMGVALATVVREGETFTTLGLQISYLRPVRHSRLEATARVIRRGSTSAFLECDIHDADGRHVARVASSCLFRLLRGE